MSGTWLVAWRELRASLYLFRTYVLLAAFGLAAAFFFFNLLGRFGFIVARLAGMPLDESFHVPTLGEVVVEGYFQALFQMLILVVPLLAMRNFVEERTSGMQELLLATPVREPALVLGKFLSLALLVSLFCALGLAFPLLLSRGGNFDTGALLTGCIGLIAIAIAMAAVALAFAAGARTQATAALASMALLGTLSTVHSAVQVLGGKWRDRLELLSPVPHLRSFIQGSVTGASLLYLALLIATGVWTATRLLQRERTHR